MPFSVAVSSMVTISSLYGTVSAEGGDTSERSSGHSVHLGHVELLQGGAGGGQGKQASLSHLVTASHWELSKTREGVAEGGQAGVGDGALAEVQGAQPAAAARQADQAGK